MAKATIAEIRKAILKELSKDGTAVGNQSLRERIAERLDAKVREEDYFEARDALIEEGKLETGRGRGGSVRRVVRTAEAVPVEPQPVTAIPVREPQAAPATDEPKASAVATAPSGEGVRASELTVIATNGNGNGHLANGNGKSGNGNGGGVTLALGNVKVAFATQGDAPSCMDCGAIMVRNGSCYKCLNCGSTSGCS